MSSITPFLVKRANAKNLYPVSIRIIKDRKASYIYLGQAIKMNQWDSKNCCVKSSHPDYLEINQLIITKLSKINKRLLNAEIDDERMTSISIKEQITFEDDNEFFNVAKIFLAQLRIENNSINMIFKKSELKYSRTF